MEVMEHKSKEILFEQDLNVGDQVIYSGLGKAKEGVIVKRTKRTITIKLNFSTVKLTFISKVPASDLGLSKASQVIVRLEMLNIGDHFKYNLADVGIFKVMSKQDPNWIDVVRIQSGRNTGSFPWTEVYPIKEVSNGN